MNVHTSITKWTGGRSLQAQMKPPSYTRSNESQGEKGPSRKESEKQGGKCPMDRAQGGDEGTRKLPGPGWCGSVGWASSWKAKGHWFNSKSGHMSALWVWSSVMVHMRGNRSMFL